MTVRSSAARSAIATTSEQALFFPWDPPQAIDESVGLEIGLRFFASVAGQLIGVRFWMPSNDATATITVRAWSSAGALLALKAVTGFAAGGWVRVNFDTALDLALGTVYVVSRDAVTGLHPVRDFAFPITVGDLTAPSDTNGVYTETPGTFPNTSSPQGENFFVDPVFRRADPPAGASANVAWGPDFGESSDDNTATVGAILALSHVALESALAVACQCTVGNVGAEYSGPGGAAHLSATALGAPFWQSEAHTALTVGAANITVNVPPGTVDGDLLVAFVATRNTVALGVQDLAGWTAVSTAGISFVAGRCFRRIASSEPASYTFTFDGSVTNATAEIHRVIGVDAVTPIDGSAPLEGTGLSPADPVCPSVTTTVANCLVLAWVAHDHLALSQSHTPPPAHVEQTDYESINAALFAGSTLSWRVFAAAGATGAATVDCTETVATVWASIRVAIRPGTLTLAP